MQPTPQFERLVYALYDIRHLEDKHFSAEASALMAKYFQEMGAEFSKLSKSLKQRAYKE